MANEGMLDLTVVDVRGRGIRDPRVRLVIQRSADRRRLYEARAAQFPGKCRLQLPAFPQARNLVCLIGPSRYRHRSSGVFTLTAGQTLPCRLTVLRRPSRWRARFVRWKALGPEFDALKLALDRSPFLDVKGGRSLGRFVADRYDDVDDRKTILAKTALLNLFVKLSVMAEPVGKQRSWASFIEEVIEIGRERFIARVQPEMGQVVQKIKRELHRFEGYKNTPAQNHFSNLPHERYRFERKDMFSIKSREALGNVQLTLAPGRDPRGGEILVLDADIDENGELLAHLGDLCKHKFNGGTHPFDIHEYLVLAYPDRALGYRLV